ncbi:mitochondrial presequence protease [Venturia nashicola]|uniref:Mitochondrial presequence protease n=1 Tax=Venturia nashicola TaxID=86259 RepID=A0A4Z1PPY5_9PEZI|nr:mitochondrial presequence protease [Venturia nashicola]
MATLPAISEIPRHHPECCLSLSTKLIQAIGQRQSHGSTVISIGSGSGLLETLIQQRYSTVRVIGLEVNNLVNKYLPPENAVTVKGTWDIYNKSSEYNTWLFVYPRSPKLISSYLELPMVPYTIIWLGPRKDWDDFRTPFVASEFKLEEIEDAGLVHYETMVLMTKESSLSSADGFVPLSKSQIDEI